MFMKFMVRRPYSVLPSPSRFPGLEYDAMRLVVDMLRRKVKGQGRRKGTLLV